MLSAAALEVARLSPGDRHYDHDHIGYHGDDDHGDHDRADDGGDHDGDPASSQVPKGNHKDGDSNGHW